MGAPAHTLWGPSVAARRIACAGSLNAELEAMKHMEPTESVYAVIGSGAHKLAEMLLLESDPLIQAEDWIGEQVFVEKDEALDAPVEFDAPQVETHKEPFERGKDGYLVTVDSEMAHNVQQFVDRCNQLRNDPDCMYWAAEGRYKLDRWLPGNHGTADFVAVVGDTIYVVDLKYGKGVQVFADSNPQLMLYGLGVYDKIEPLVDGVTDFALRIHQPRLDHLDTWRPTIESVMKWADDVLVPAYNLSQEPDAPRSAGEHCRFCTAKPTCNAVRDYVEEHIRDKFPIMGGEAKLPDDCIPLDVAAVAKDWANAVEAYAVKRLEAGEKVTDGKQYYKLVHGRSMRKWSDEDKAKSILLDMYGDRIMTEPKLKSVAQVEKEIGKRAMPEIAPLVEKKPGKPTLAPETDPRPAINSAEALGFDDETKED